MCLYIDYKQTVDDNKVYTFYKLYIKSSTKGMLACIYRPNIIDPKLPLVAQYSNTNLPEDGATAYQEEYKLRYYIEAQARYGSSSQNRHIINYGIHAYTRLSDLRREQAFLITCSYTVCVEVKVKGKHVMAFGRNGDVVFTRGHIVKEIKL